MKAEGLKFFTDTHLTLIALILFVIVFTVIVITQWKRYDRNLVGKMERLPLENEFGGMKGEPQ